jgi:hypothetical protein
MRIDLCAAEINPLGLIIRVEYHIQYLYGRLLGDSVSDPQGLIIAGLPALYGFNKGTKILLD